MSVSSRATCSIIYRKDKYPPLKKNPRILELPTEITCLIFLYAHRSHKLEKVNIIVSHVCRSWRRMALSCSPLWSLFTYIASWAPRVPISRLQAYFERSRNEDLELWLDFRCNPRKIPEYLTWPDQHVQLLNMAIQRSIRWKRVTLLFDQTMPGIIYMLPSKLRTLSVPRLEHFAFLPEGWRDEARTGIAEVVTFNSTEPTIFINGAPKLTSLRVDGGGFLRCSPSLFRITTLRLESHSVHTTAFYSWSAFRSILKLPSLANLSLYGDMFHGELSPVSMRPIQMNNLRHLRYGANTFMADILLAIRAPLLETLVIHEDTFQGLPLSSILMHPHNEPYSFPSLHTLHLYNFKASNSQVAWYFVRMTKFVKNVFICHQFRSPEFGFVTSIPWEFMIHPSCWTGVENLSLAFLNANGLIDLKTRNFIFTRKPGVSLAFHLEDDRNAQYLNDLLKSMKRPKVRSLSAEEMLVVTWPPSKYPPDYIFEKNDIFNIVRRE